MFYSCNSLYIIKTSFDLVSTCECTCDVRVTLNLFMNPKSLNEVGLSEA